ncbi:MAG: hypothetical protein JW953_17630 [Anaerolineae bacterium]|nr:hypothetical protein [Anaerolineae bacterium]
MVTENSVTSPPLEAATFYLMPDHQIILEEIRLKLRRQNIKASKSKLARVAIQLLEEQPIADIIRRLKLDRGEK